MAFLLTVNGLTSGFEINNPNWVYQGRTPDPFDDLYIDSVGSFFHIGVLVDDILISGDAEIYLDALPTFPFHIDEGAPLHIICALDASAAPGVYEAEIIIQHRANNSPYRIPVSMEIVAATATTKEIGVTPNPFNFGNQLNGTASAEQIFTITNQGEDVVNIAAPTFPTDFAAGATTPSYPVVLNPGDTVDFGIVFDPNSIGFISQTVTVNSDADDPTYDLTLMGTGTNIDPEDPVSGFPLGIIVSSRDESTTVTYFMDPESLDSETPAFAERVHNLERPGVKKSTLDLHFKYEDLGECTVTVTIETTSETKSLEVTVGTVGADGEVKDATVSPLEVEGELVRIRFDKAADDGPLSIVDYIVTYQDWVVRKGTTPVPAEITPVATVESTLTFIIATAGVDETQLTADNLRNTTCGVASDITCALIEDFLCAELADTLEVGWTRNARIGPFFGVVPNRVVFIGRDPGNGKKLAVIGSDAYGERGTWSRRHDTFAALTNNIISHDCHQVGNDIYIAIQETTTGRVSFYQYNLLTGWVTTNVAVVASAATNEGGCVSIGRYNAAGEIGILYEAAKENVSAVDYTRSGYKYSSNDGATWSAELQVGNWGDAVNCGPARVVLTSAGRAQCFMGDGDSTDFFGHYRLETVLANHTLSGPTMWAGGSALHQIQIGRMGDYCTFQLAGVTQIVFLGRMLSGAHYALFADSNSMSAPYQPSDVRDGDIGSTMPGLGGGVEAAYPQISARMDSDNILHLMAVRFSNSVPTWFYHKVAASPYAPANLDPAANLDEDQAGPNFTTGIPGQEMAASIVRVGDDLFYASLRDSGAVGLGLVYNIIKISTLPTDSAFTIELWDAQCEDLT